MINSERELLDKAIALREENRALRALVQTVLNDVKRTVLLPPYEHDNLYDCALSGETLQGLMDLGGDDVRFGGSRTAKSRTGTEETTSETKNAVRKQQ